MVMKKMRKRIPDKSNLFLYILFVLALPSLLYACNTGKPTLVIPPPVVAITAPVNNHSIPSGIDIPINSTANDAQGIIKIELWVDDSLYRVDASPEPDGQTTFVVSQPWHADVVGSHKMVVKAFSKSGQVGESLPVMINVIATASSVSTDTPALATATLPAVTDTPIPPTPTSTLTLPPPDPTNTSTLLPPSPTDTATLPPEPTKTSLPTAVPEPFGSAWAATGGSGGRLGNPVAKAVLGRWAADQFYEGGLSFWRNNESDPPTDYIYVLFYKGTDETLGEAWLQLDDLWHEGLPQFSCPEAEANGDLGPKRGFGKVWCENITVRTGLNLPVSIELGANAGFQDFEHGTMLWLARLEYIYILYQDGSDWQRFNE